MTELTCDILVAGGGTGGCAAALAACREGRTVIMTEPCEWIGGQLTSQAVPPDENRFIEMHSATRSYETYREKVRAYYRMHYPFTADARMDPHMNPGTGRVSRLSHEPKVSHAVLREMLAPYESRGLLQIIRFVEPASAETDGDRVRSVTFRSLRGEPDVMVSARYVLDATELGDLLPLTGTEFITGAESQNQTGELHARRHPDPNNVQAVTWCFAMGYDPTPDADHRIEKPEQYERWRDYVPRVSPAWPGKLLSWTDVQPWTLEEQRNCLFDSELASPQINGRSYFGYRQIVGARLWDPAHQPHDATIVNWPMNDYIEANF